MQSESHPHAHNQGPRAAGSKEGLSLYGLFHHLARTPQGKYLLRQYFLRPSLNIDLINERLDAIGVFLRPNNQGAVESITKSLNGVFNVRTSMINLRKGITGGSGKAGGIARSVWTGLQKVVMLLFPVRSLSVCLHYSSLPITLSASRESLMRSRELRGW